VQVLGAKRDVVITAHPDTTVQGFRGARLQALVTRPEILSSEAKTTAVVTGDRMGDQLGRAYQRTVGRVPAVAGLPDIRTDLKPSRNAAETAVHRLASPTQEHLFIVQQVLELHHRHGIAFEDMAVLARTSAKVAEVATALEA